MDDFKTTLDRMLMITGKTLNQVAEDGGVDRAYLFRLYHGDKSNPSPEIVMRIWIGLIFDRRILEKDLTMLYGLNELAGSVVKTMGPRKMLG
jgi:hypothetical protein